METKKEAFEHFILNKFIFGQNLVLEMFYLYFISKSFQGCSKIFKNI